MRFWRPTTVPLFSWRWPTVDHVSTTELTPGASVALAFPSLHVRPDELQMFEMAYVAALSLVPGALIGLFGHTGRQRRVFSVAWVLAFAVLLEATIVRVSGGAFDWADVAASRWSGRRGAHVLQRDFFQR